MEKEKIQEQNSTTRYDLSEEDFQKLARVLRVPTITQVVRSQLLTALVNYCIDAVHIPQIPREAEEKSALVKIRDTTKELIGLMEKLPEKTQQRLQSAGYWAGSSLRPGESDKSRSLSKKRAKERLEKWKAEHPHEDPLVIRRAQYQHEDSFREPDVYKLFSATEQALETLGEDKGGRPKEKAALRGFIGDLRLIFEEITGKKATANWNEYKGRRGGPFYDFVHTYLEITNRLGDAGSDVALGEQIKIVCSQPRPTSSPLGRKPTI